MPSRTVLLLALVLATVSRYSALAQQQPGRLAVDHCGVTATDDPYDDDGYIFGCDVYVHDLASGYSWRAGSGYFPALSPDGTRLAFFEVPSGDSPSEPANLTVVTLRDGSRLTLPLAGSGPALSFDGRIAFVSARTGTLELYVVNADGSGLSQVTSGSGVYGEPSWSPDGRIAFVCKTDLDRTDICSIRSDGTQLARLTNLGNVTMAVFSPDGYRIAFVRRGVTEPLGILNADGTITDLNWYGIYDPSWSPDGNRIAFTGGPAGIGCDAGDSCGSPFIEAINVDGTGAGRLSWGTHPSWGLSPPDGLPPTAYFLAECTQLVCAFDGAWSRDDAPIASYQWRFGDGSVASGMTPSHTYAARGSYDVELTVVDSAGLRATMTLSVDVTDHVNSPPEASFTVDCLGLACRFDASGSSDADDGIAWYFWTFGDGVEDSTPRGSSHTYVPGTYVVTLTVRDRAGATDSSSLQIAVTNAPPLASFGHQCDPFAFCTFQPTGSSDPDGSIVSYLWDFGDGHQATDWYVTHTYAAAGTYLVALTVTDNHGATSTRSASITVPRAVYHIGDLDGVIEVDKKTWTVTVRVVVHDADHRPVVASIVGVWSTGDSTGCYFDSNGVCTIPAAILPASTRRVTFTVQGVQVSAGTPPYDAVQNHDVDGGSNGTSITISRR